jgi:ABC-type amino acid transport substrate-binding protein
MLMGTILPRVRRHRQVLTICAIALPILAIGIYWRIADRPIARTLRIGFQNSPPYHYPDAQGRPTGVAVDLIAAAAKRANLRLEWAFSPKGPDRSLTDGDVDLWPVMTDLPERRKALYVSPPWAKMTYAIVHPESFAVKGPEDLSGKTLAVTNRIGSDAKVAERLFLNVRMVSAATANDVVEDVCQGTAEGGLLTLNALANPPKSECPERPLRLLPIPGATYWFGVGATRKRQDAELAADRLRDEIGKMAADGTLLTIDFRWNTHLTTEAATIIAYRQAQVFELVFLCALALLAPTLLFTS